MEATRGTIFDIQSFSVHDGPGIRSTVFFKGCPLSCKWCSNPESQTRSAQLLWFESLCIGCGACVEVCPEHAMVLDGGVLRYDRDACTACGACAPTCLEEARILSGRSVTVDEVCDEVRQHWRVFMQSGGGVTCGGGEALAQPAFLAALLERLHDELGFHTCLDTCGHAPWEVLEPLLPRLNLILLDLKHMDSRRHRAATGLGNEPILANARRLGLGGFPVIVRLPLIPGFNDDDENADALGRFMTEVELPRIEIMPYHEFSRSKYDALGWPFAAYQRDTTRIEPVVRILEDHGLEVLVHGR